jgi:methionyl-tRNA formyltransferase
MKIVFFGTPQFVDPVLVKLQENYDVTLSVREPVEFNPEYIEKLRNLNPDLFFVAAYGQILPKEVLNIPKMGTINIHPSLLPFYRGASPIQSAILNGDQKTGVSFIKMDEEMDHGPVILQFESGINSDDTFESLANRLFNEAADQVVEAISKVGEAKAQDDSAATFTKILKKEDGKIYINNPPTLEILNRSIRAYYPWPGIWFEYDLNGKQTLIKLLPEGMIQVEGKKPMSFKDFKNGYEKGEEVLSKLGLG